MYLTRIRSCQACRSTLPIFLVTCQTNHIQHRRRMQSTFSCPSEANYYLHDHVGRMLASWHHWTGRYLIDPKLSKPEQARRLFNAPFVVLSHDTASDPMLNYANQTGLALFEMSWDELVRTPSRLTAEPIHREERRLARDRDAAGLHRELPRCACIQNPPEIYDRASDGLESAP